MSHPPLAISAEAVRQARLSARVPSSSSDSPGLQQDRVRSYLKFFTLLFAVFYLIDAVERVSRLGWSGAVHADHLATFILQLGLFAGWG